MTRLLVIAIDGPAGAGKSTVSKALAERLGIPRLDTGSMYRAATWVVLEEGIDPSNEAAVAARAERLDLRVEPDGIWIDGVNREEQIRRPEVTASVSSISRHPRVRTIMVEKQQQMARSTGGVIEGRDIGSVVAPWADLKVFLTAEPQERAARRGIDLFIAGHDVDPDEVVRQITERDAQDNQTTPLMPADGAVLVDSTGKTLDDVVAEILALIEERV